MSAIIEAHELKKGFGRTEALDGLTLDARRGEVTCVLGPNGAGKSTLLRLVATLLRPDSGRLVVDGTDAVRHPGRVRRAIGLAGQSVAVEATMTGRENLELVGRLVGHDRRRARQVTEGLVAQLGLSDVADELVRTYSGGTCRKFDLAASLVGAPTLLLLDEPTTGLDPRSRGELWDCIRRLVAEGMSVLLTTQHLEEADQLADHIAIVDHGRVIAEGSPGALKGLLGGEVLEVRVGCDADLDRASAALLPLGSRTARIEADTRRITVPVDQGCASLMGAVRSLDRLGVGVTDIALRRPTLDEVFLAITGSAAPGAPAGAVEGPRTRRAGTRRRAA